MQEPYGERVATDTGPESCAGAREGMGEALDRGTSGLGIEPRKCDMVRGADAVIIGGRLHRPRRQGETRVGPCVVRDPRHARKLSARELGDPVFDRRYSVRAGNPKGRRRQ